MTRSQTLEALQVPCVQDLARVRCEVHADEAPHPRSAAQAGVVHLRRRRLEQSGPPTSGSHRVQALGLHDADHAGNHARGNASRLGGAEWLMTSGTCARRPHVPTAMCLYSLGQGSKVSAQTCSNVSHSSHVAAAGAPGWRAAPHPTLPYPTRTSGRRTRLARGTRLTYMLTRPKKWKSSMSSLGSSVEVSGKTLMRTLPPPRRTWQPGQRFRAC